MGAASVADSRGHCVSLRVNHSAVVRMDGKKEYKNNTKKQNKDRTMPDRTADGTQRNT